jgi:hypothetical protein
MANEPVTLSGVTSDNVAPGWVCVRGTLTGPALYDATNGAAFDLSSYLTTIYGGVAITGTDTQADAGYAPMYFNAASTASTGKLAFAWDTANSGDAEDARAFTTATEDTVMNTLVFTFEAWGTPPTR